MNQSNRPQLLTTAAANIMKRKRVEYLDDTGVENRQAAFKRHRGIDPAESADELEVLGDNSIEEGHLDLDLGVGESNLLPSLPQEDQANELHLFTESILNEPIPPVFDSISSHITELQSLVDSATNVDGRLTENNKSDDASIAPTRKNEN